MKKGFTLIELLAVILILGIISLIAIPKVSNILKESKKNSFNTSVKNIASAIEDKCSKDVMQDKETTYLYTFNDGNVTPSVEVNGKLPDSGYITLNSKCEADIINVTNGEYYVNGTSESTELNTNKKINPVADKGYKMYLFFVEGENAIDANSISTLDTRVVSINGVILNKAGITTVYFNGYYSNSVSTKDAKEITALLNKKIVDDNKTSFFDKGFDYYIDYENGKTYFIGDNCTFLKSQIGPDVCVSMSALEMIGASSEEQFVQYGGNVINLK